MRQLEPLSSFPRSEQRTRGISTPGAILCILALYASLVYVCVELGPRGMEACNRDFWAGCDEISHIQQINFFIAHPASLLHYPAATATTPGFHALIAWLARISGIAAVTTDTWLRGVPFLLGVGVLGILWWSFRALGDDAWSAALLCLPILTSKYFLLPSAYLLTDIAGYVGYVLLLFAYLRFPERGILIGITGAMLTFCRQIYLAVVLTPLFTEASVFAFERSRLHFRTIRFFALAVVPPLALAAVYAVAWGGLVPPGPDTRIHVSGVLLNPAPIVEAWALLGLLTVPYGLLVYPSVRALGGPSIRRCLLMASAAAIVIWAIFPSTLDTSAALTGNPGRWGSIVWSLAGVSPVVYGRALLVLPCLVLGFAACATAIEFAQSLRYFPTEFLMYTIYTSSLCLQAYSFQRYTEVAALVTLSVTCARLQMTRSGAVALLVAYVIKLPLTLFVQLGR